MPARQLSSEPPPLPAQRRTGPRTWLLPLALLLALLGQLLHVHPAETQEFQGHHHAVLTASSADEAICPLCVAMHSASAQPPVRLPEPFWLPAPLLSTASPQVPPAPPGHAHWSRPPPAR